MGAAVAIGRLDMTASALRAAASREKDGAVAGGDTGSATVFVFGGTTPPRFRWVASRRGCASCMRHYGAGPCSGPDRM